jgi:uncharacterized membrane protein
MEVRLRETDRLEFFSDGVFAIVATLLVVEIKAPSVAELHGMPLLAFLNTQWPSYVAFVASFLFIGIAWAAHHDMFYYIKRTTHVLLMINLIFLMSIALQPFSTALVARHFGHADQRTAVIIYYAVLLTASLSYNAMWQYAMRRRLVDQETGSDLLAALSKEHAVAPILHLAAMITAFWSVPFSLLPVLAQYFFFALPRVTERGGPFLPRRLRSSGE